MTSPEPNPALLNQQANALVNARRPAEALPLFHRALALAPAEPKLHNNLALALTDLGRFAEAQAAFLESIRLNPAWPPAHNNLAQLYIMMARHEDALTTTDVALTLDPTLAPAKRNRALALLSLGRFQEAWPDYDFANPRIAPPPSPLPTWTGQPLDGKHLLLTAYNGLGDTLQFIRYAPLLRQSAARVTLEVPTPLAEILKSAPGLDGLIPQGQSFPQADFTVPLMALPRLFNTTLATIPDSVPYLTPDSARIQHWQNKLREITNPTDRLVGLVWQGNPHHQWDRFRSIPLQQFLPLTRIPNLRLVSLQRGPGVEQLAPFNLQTQKPILTPLDPDQPDSLADTAALMSLLHHIITIDSAPAHLAGALAFPATVLLAQPTDWRWLTTRSDSPWYPTLTLLRQKTPNDWHPLIRQLTHQLTLPRLDDLTT